MGEEMKSMVTRTVITKPEGMENAGFHIEATEEDGIYRSWIVDEKTGFKSILYGERAGEETFSEFVEYSRELAEKYGTQSGFTDEV